MNRHFLIPALLAGSSIFAASCGRLQTGAAPRIPSDQKTLVFLSPEWATSDWESFFSSPSLAQIRFGVLLGGNTPYSRNTKEVFVPASNAKLFTAIAALEVLEEGFRYQTDFSWRRSSNHAGRATQFTILGHGDPSWTSTSVTRDLMAQWARRIKETGIQEIQEPILWGSQDPRWAEHKTPIGWSNEDLANCYGAQAHAFNWALNCGGLQIWTSSQGLWQSRWSDLRVTPTVKIDVTVDPKSPQQLNATWKNPAQPDLGYVIRGKVPALPNANHPLQFRLPLAAAVVLAHLQMEWRSILKEEGIRLIPPAVMSGTLGSLTQLSQVNEFERFSHSSMTLRELLVPFLKNSLNFLGDAIWKATGSRWDASAPDLLTAGGKVMDAFLTDLGAATARSLGVRETPGFFSSNNMLVDGSGLSRSSRLTVEAVMALLRDLLTDHERKFLPIFEALPIAGVDGTLANRMKETEAAGVLRAKTGTLSGVYNLSGYIPRDGAQAIPFVMLSETGRGQGETARKAQDDAAVQLVRIVRSSDKAPERMALR